MVEGERAEAVPAGGFEALKERVRNLEGWQKTQNGAIHRVESKIDRLQGWILTELAAVVIAAFGVIVMLLRR
jgi:hypothetical protein